MASIRQRAHEDGSLTRAVLGRDRDSGKQTSRTVEDQREAVMLKDFLDANGNSFRLAARPVDKMTCADIALCFNNLDVAPKTRKNIHAILSAALARAVDEKLIDTNPAKGIRGPQSSRHRDAVFLTPERCASLRRPLTRAGQA